ncbi:alpha/beta hydrolase [Polaribacter atrinae]|uniref:alpha/beta hydrolase n=1 Tax=Polaribacter atrinae TaxID=1333662 RepID=UPI0030F9B796
MKKHLLFILVLFAVYNSFSQSEIVEIWDVVPNSKTTEEQEVITLDPIKKISLVKTPTLEIYLPSKRNRRDKSVIIFPGGGYSSLAYDWEGSDIAKWFNSKGITAFILKYRLPNPELQITQHNAPLQDAQRAIRWVRLNAEKWNISPNKIGIIGFSAGGHLAATLGTQYNTPNNFKEQAVDTISARPNFMALIYSVITMQDNYTHKGSRNKLLGKNPTILLKDTYSNELHVTQNTPPTFLVHSADDSAVPIENSLNLYKALKDNSINVEMHLYPYGKHGYSLALNKGYLQKWPNLLYDWLDNLSLDKTAEKQPKK